jgi:hypothetical protein
MLISDNSILELLQQTLRWVQSLLRSNSFHALLLIAVFFVPQAWAAGGPPMITDDPGTPGDGHWEINLAAQSTTATNATTYQLPLVDINYGVGDRTQLKFEMPWLFQEEVTGTSRSGAGDALAGVKWRFYDAGENAWQISTYPQISFGFPLLDAPNSTGLEDPGTSYLLPVEFEHGFEGFDINFELGRWIRPVNLGDSWIAGFVLTREVRKGVELIAELHEEAAVQSTQDELILNFGARYDLSEKYTLLLSAGRDLHNSLETTNTLLTYVGLQMRY